MKKYKLKKELPVFNVGDIFEMVPNGDLYWSESNGVSVRTKNIIVYSHYMLEHYPSILKDWFEEIPEAPKTVWDLEGTMQCWVIGDGSVWPSRWCDIVGAVDKRNVGRIALTKDEADKELGRLKAKQILLRDTKGFKLDFDKANELMTSWWTVAYDFDIDSLGLYGFGSRLFGEQIVFANEKDAEASLKKHEKEWKIYLGVEDE